MHSMLSKQVEPPPDFSGIFGRDRLKFAPRPPPPAPRHIRSMTLARHPAGLESNPFFNLSRQHCGTPAVHVHVPQILF